MQAAMQWQSNMTNPYKLPKGNVLISLSGGRTSAYMLHQICVANDGLRDDVVVAFANTGREMEGTIDFIKEIQFRWQINVRWIEYRKAIPKYEEVGHNSVSLDGKPFMEMIDSKSANKFLPNQNMRFCTQELKVKTIKRFLVGMGWKRWTNTVGIRGDEPRRLRESKDNRWVNWYPIADAKETVKDVNYFWEQQPFDLKIMKGPGNCDGCFLKSEATLAAMIREYPERMQWWIDMEEKTGGKFHKNRTYKSLSEFVSLQRDWIFDEDAYLCQADDGECTG